MEALRYVRRIFRCGADIGTICDEVVFDFDRAVVFDKVGCFGTRNKDDKQDVGQESVKTNSRAY